MAGNDHTGGRQELNGLRMFGRSPLLDGAQRYWEGLRKGGTLPRRTALDPSDMTPFLSHAMVLDRVRPGTIRVRLGGRVMQQLMGMDVRGLPVRAFFDLADRDRVVQMIEQVFATPATLELDLISEADSGMVTARILVLPLLDEAGQVSKALCVTVTDKVVTDPPRRFSLTNGTLVPLSRVRGSAEPARIPAPLPPAPLPETQLPQDISGFAETATPFEAKPSAVPWLRVVK